MNKSQHKYEYSVSKCNRETSANYIFEYLRDVPSVLELGLGPGSITKILVNKFGCKVTAIEIDETVTEQLSEYCEDVIVANLNDKNWHDRLLTQKYDVVLAADVLEHLYSPGDVLKQMGSMISSDGAVVVSLPHISHCVIHACLMDEDFEYRDWGLLDKTHIRFFGLKNMQSLFAEAGMKIVDAKFVIRRPEDTEYAERWSRISPDIQNMLMSLPFGMVYQCVIKAKHMGAVEPAINLISLGVESKPTTLEDRIRRLVKRYFPERIYIRMRAWYMEYFNK